MYCSVVLFVAQMLTHWPGCSGCKRWLWIISEVLCMVAAPCSASYDWSQIMCVALVALCSCREGALCLWCQLLFSYWSGKTTRKFLADGWENINKILCCIG